MRRLAMGGYWWLAAWAGCARAQQLDQQAIARQIQAQGNIMRWQLEHPQAQRRQAPDMAWEWRWHEFLVDLIKYEKSRQAGAPDARIWKRLRKESKEFFQ